jgi:hypothetical protein
MTVTTSTHSPIDGDFMIVQDIYKNKNNSEEYLIIEKGNTNNNRYKNALENTYPDLNINSISDNQTDLNNKDKKNVKRLEERLKSLKTDKGQVLNKFKLLEEESLNHLDEEDLFTESELKELNKLNSDVDEELKCPVRKNNTLNCKYGKEVVYDNPEKYGEKCPYIICKGYEKNSSLLSFFQSKIELLFNVDIHTVYTYVLLILTLLFCLYYFTSISKNNNI